MSWSHGGCVLGHVHAVNACQMTIYLDPQRALSEAVVFYCELLI